MLTAEEARARLLAIRNDDWRTTTTERIASLEPADRHVATVLMEPSPDHTVDPAEARRRFQDLWRAAEHLDGLDDDQRVALMTALHPALGAVLARWWVAAQGEPYIQGWSRRAFRAPHNPELTRRTRAERLPRMLPLVGPYDADAAWLAAWAPHIGREHSGHAPSLAQKQAGSLIAAAIDLGGPQGDQVLQTLVEIGRGEHPIGVMDRHVVVALLRAARPEGWDFVERLLLAAQHQEGLRQVILEAADEGHPDAFDRILDLVAEHNLLRFAATVRAVSVWFGSGVTVEHIPELTARVNQLRRFRRDDSERRAALLGGDPWDTYVALCARATRDVMPALEEAEEALRHDDAHVRAAAVRFVGATGLGGRVAELLAATLDDPDLAVAMLARGQTGWSPAKGAPPDAYDRLERLAHRLPETPRTSGPIGIEHDGVELSRASVVDAMLWARGERPLTVLLPWFGAMSVSTKRSLAMAIGEEAKLTPDLRAVVLRMVGDHSKGVRETAIRSIEGLGVESADAPALEALLTRRRPAAGCDPAARQPAGPG